MGAKTTDLDASVYDKTTDELLKGDGSYSISGSGDFITISDVGISSATHSVSGSSIAIDCSITIDEDGRAFTPDGTEIYMHYGTGGSIPLAGSADWFDMYYQAPKKKKIKNEKTTLKMDKVKDVLEKVYSNDSLRKTIVPLFIGNPGLGKTVIIQEFAKEKKCVLVELITSQMSPFEISGIAMPDKDIKKMVYYNFDKLENLVDGDILFFDELLNGNPIVLNACLTILEQRKFISGRPLPNIMIIAAANPQGMTPLTPQIKERFVWYNVIFQKNMWVKYMMEKYDLTKAICNKMATLISKEEFETNNFFTPRSIDKAVNMLIHNVETPYKGNIEPILMQLIKNPFREEVSLSRGVKLAPGEMIPWLKLIKLKMKIK